MTRQPKHFFLLLLLLAIPFSTAYAQTSGFTGQVVSVSDGDSITVLDSNNVQHRIRFQGVDAPDESQDFGPQAKEQLSALVLGQTVEVIPLGRDQYGRVAAKVMLDGRDVGLVLIEAGYAWHYKEFEKEQSKEDRKLYADSEKRARNSSIGLWVNRSATPPWKYRKSKKVPETAETEANTTTTPKPSEPSPSSSGGTVSVRGYYRKDGTYVKPHTRKAPKRRN